MLFPGQGSQYVGMLRELACRFPRMQAALARCDRASARDRRPRLRDRIYPPAGVRRRRARTARRTPCATPRFAQPAIGAVSLGLLGILEDFGVRARRGRRSQLRRADRALRGRPDRRPTRCAVLARRRGPAHGRAAPATAVGRDARGLRAARARSPRCSASDALDLVIANKNAPRQCVLSGPAAEIERAPRGVRRARDHDQAARRLGGVPQPVRRRRARSRSARRSTRSPSPAATIPVFANTTAAALPRRRRAGPRPAGRPARPAGRVRRADRGDVPDRAPGPSSKSAPTPSSPAWSARSSRAATHAALAVDASRGPARQPASTWPARCAARPRWVCRSACRSGMTEPIARHCHDRDGPQAGPDRQDLRGEPSPTAHADPHDQRPPPKPTTAHDIEPGCVRHR